MLEFAAVRATCWHFFGYSYIDADVATMNILSLSKRSWTHYGLITFAFRLITLATPAICG